jgi:predicted lipoprotein with Yx(FWY)xxD motif
MITLRRAPFLAAAAVAGLSALAACGSSTTKTSAPVPSSSPSSSAPYSAPSSAPPATSAPAAGAAALKVGTPKFDEALTDSGGKAVYLFEADTGPTSTCNGACATAWPPVTTTGTPTITGGDASKLGTTMRSDGTKQVTYGGHPLYYFVHDTKAGDTNGQGLHAFGADWYLIGTNGSKIDNS